MESWSYWTVSLSIATLCKGHSVILPAISQVKRGPCIPLPEITLLSLIFSVGFFAFSHHFFTSWALGLVLMLWRPVAPINPAKGRTGRGQLGQPQPLASGTSTALPHSLAVSPEVRAKAEQHGHIKTGLGPQRAEYLGKGQIVAQTSGSLVGDHSSPFALETCLW